MSSVRSDCGRFANRNSYQKKRLATLLRASLFRSPLVVTLRYLSASLHRIAVMGGLWKLGLRGRR